MNAGRSAYMNKSMQMDTEHLRAGLLDSDTDVAIYSRAALSARWGPAALDALLQARKAQDDELSVYGSVTGGTTVGQQHLRLENSCTISGIVVRNIHGLLIGPPAEETSPTAHPSKNTFRN